MTLEELLKAKKEILQIAERFGASNVRIFGSVVRGRAKASSDVDVLVDLEAGRTLLDHAGLAIELEKLLGCKVDVVTEKGLRNRIKQRVLKEAVPL